MPTQTIVEIKVKPGMAGMQIHADRNAHGGAVDFYAEEPCMIIFKNPAVFDMHIAELKRGSNIFDVELNDGQTGFEVHPVPTAKTKTGSGPNDIIVP